MREEMRWATKTKSMDMQNQDSRVLVSSMWMSPKHLWKEGEQASGMFPCMRPHYWC